MPATFTYREAVAILGGAQHPTVAALDRVFGGTLLAAATGLPNVLGLFDAKVEFVRLSHDLVTSLSPARRRMRRHDRTQQIEAAHTVLVVAAFFEVLPELDLPVPWRKLGLTKSDRAHLADSLLTGPAAKPTALRSYEDTVERIRTHYDLLVDRLGSLVEGLAIWDHLHDGARRRFRQQLQQVPEHASRRYVELLRRLMVDCPELALWINAVDHQATRDQVRELGSALRRMEETLTNLSSGHDPDERRADLARAYRARLRRPILDAEDAPSGFRIPTLEAAYVDPRFRAHGPQPGRAPGDESSWDGLPIRSDLAEFLAAHLTGLDAVRTPLLILGQPGSGKSKLTEMLAARLPPSDFLPVLVQLRDVPADTDVQRQIEHAIRATTGEQLSWPELARSAGDALPVVLLDGFDDLLQATGVSQTDYLLRVRDFQQRETDQDRPVAILVTSRTAVADRARIPEHTVVLHLEPFDQSQVARWLDTWNSTNATLLTDRGLLPLRPDTVLAFPELAEQPLLLTMLAIYDADTNALQHATGKFHRGQLYERLLTQFARRQISRQQPELADRDLDTAVEHELRRLSVAALAMINRGSLWVTSTDLDRDLAALLPPRTPPAPSLRAPLTEAEVTIGRFFFVHRARASRDDRPAETYEFLHATFGEFLIARFVWQIVQSLADIDRAATASPLGAGPLDDSLLHAVLSFVPLTSRVPIVQFLTDRAATCPPDDRAAIADLLVRLFRSAHTRRPERRLTDYEPMPVLIPRRHAAYSANLVFLAVLTAGTLCASTLFTDPAKTIRHWHAETLLWRSQLDEFYEWASFVTTFATHRTRTGPHRDLVLSIDHDETFIPSPVDLTWTYDIPRDDVKHFDHYPDQDIDLLLRRADFVCGLEEDVTSHALEPLADYPGRSVSLWCTPPPPTRPTTPAHAILDLVLTLPDITDPERRADKYVAVLDLCNDMGTFEEAIFPRYRMTVIDLMLSDAVLSLSRTLLLLDYAATSSVPEAARLRYLLIALVKATPPLSRVVVSSISSMLVHPPRTDPPKDILELRSAIWTRLRQLGLSDSLASYLVWAIGPTTASPEPIEWGVTTQFGSRVKAIIQAAAPAASGAQVPAIERSQGVSEPADTGPKE